MGIVCDADDNRDGAFRSICRALRAANLPIPQEPMTMVGDHPHVRDDHPRESGRMLEDLCLAAVSDDPAISCVDEYFKCLDQQGISQKESVIPKARLHAFLGVQRAARAEAGRGCRQE